MADLVARVRRLSWELPVVVIAQLLFLGHALKTYFVGDDLINRSTSGALANSGMSYWEGVHQLVVAWWRDAGRFYPLSFYEGPPQMMWLHDVRAYKTLLLFWTVLAGVCLWLFLREVGLGRAAASLALLLASIAIQFRPQDGIIAYTGLEQIILAEMALSLLFFNRYLRLGRTRHMVLAIALFVVSSLTYESSYVFGPLYAILVLNQRGWSLWPARKLWRAVKPLIPIAVPSLVLIAVGSYGRAHALAGDGGPYAPSFDKHEIFYTLVDQVGGAVPLSYAWLDPSGLFTPFGTAIVHGLGWKDVAIGVVFAVVAFVLVRRIRLREGWNPWTMALFGAGLWVLTAGPIALATRYQQEIVGGLAHIPVVIEYFAFGVFAVGLVVGVGRRLPAPARTVAAMLFAVLVGGVAALGHRANAITVAANQPGRTLGETAELAGRTLVRDHVPTGSKMYANPGDAIYSSALYRQYSGHKITVVPADRATVAAEPARPCAPGRPSTFVLGEVTLTAQTGAAVLTCSGGPGAWVALRGLPRDRAAITALARPTDPAHAPSGVFGLVRDVDLNRVAGGVDPFGVSILPVGARAVMADWTGGCWAAESSPTGLARYCERRAQVTIFPTAHRAQRAQVRLGVLGVGPGVRSLLVTGPGVRQRIPAGASAPFPVDVPAQGMRLDVRLEGGRPMPGVSGGRRALLLTPAGTIEVT